MTVREVMYYSLNNKQLHKVVTRLNNKLESETDVKKRIKYLNALADVARVIIRKNRNNEVFMKYVTKELEDLKTQSNRVL